MVLGHERLYSDMLRLHRDRPGIAAIVKLTKSGGVVERDRQFKVQLQRSKIQEYFYGTPKCELSPYSMLVGFDEVKIWRVGEALAPSSALPLGMESSESETQIVKVDAMDMCLHSILGIIDAKEGDPESRLLEKNVIGFIYVYVQGRWIQTNRKGSHFGNADPK